MAESGDDSVRDDAVVTARAWCVCGVDLHKGKRQRDSADRYWRRSCSVLDARNRETETLAYLESDWDGVAAITAVLLRVPYDLDALSRHGMIDRATGKFDEAKRNFTKVIRLATQRNDALASIDGTANPGIAYQLLDEIDDASKHHNRALFQGFWCCPVPGCSGIGCCFDI